MSSLCAWLYMRLGLHLTNYTPDSTAWCARVMGTPSLWLGHCLLTHLEEGRCSAVKVRSQEQLQGPDSLS